MPRDRQTTAVNGKPARGGRPKPAQQREAAVIALLSAKTVADAAAQCGVGERTLHRWIAEDESFKKDLEQARLAAFSVGIGRIQALTGKAVEALDHLLGSELETVKMQAVRTQLELATYHHESATIIDKLATIEAQLGGHLSPAASR